jgi:hypothetical protein
MGFCYLRHLQECIRKITDVGVAAWGRSYKTGILAISLSALAGWPRSDEESD